MDQLKTSVHASTSNQVVPLGKTVPRRESAIEEEKAHQERALMAKVLEDDPN
jgi:hypothetical protein